MRVTLLDDNFLMSTQISAKLTQLGLAHQVIGSPKDAVDRIAAAPPSVILVNLSADRLQPLGLVRAIRADPRLAEVPIIGYTGHTEQALIDAGRQAGCDRVIANSAITGDLRAMLARAMVARWLQPSTPSEG